MVRGGSLAKDRDQRELCSVVCSSARIVLVFTPSLYRI